MCAQSYPFSCFRAEEPSGVVRMEARRPPIDNIIRKDSERRTQTELLDIECYSSFHTFASHFCRSVACFCKRRGYRCVCVSITCWQHTPITRFMFVSFHDAIRILAYPWLCTNRLCPLFFFCVVLFHNCMQCRTIRLFAFPLLRISSLRYALPLLCVSHIASPFGGARFIATPSLIFSAILRALPLRFFASSSPLLYLSVLFLCFDYVNLCASS